MWKRNFYLFFNLTRFLKLGVIFPVPTPQILPIILKALGPYQTTSIVKPTVRPPKGNESKNQPFTQHTLPEHSVRARNAAMQGRGQNEEDTAAILQQLPDQCGTDT